MQIKISDPHGIMVKSFKNNAIQKVLINLIRNARIIYI